MSNDLPERNRERVLESFRICRQEVQHEYDVLANRLTTYIMSQSFLVSAFAVSMNNTNEAFGSMFRIAFPLLLSVFGIILSIRANPGIVGVCEIIKQWHVHQSELLEAHSDLHDYAVLKSPEVKRVNERSLLFSQTAPWVFGVAWVMFALLALWIHWCGDHINH